MRRDSRALSLKLPIMRNAGGKIQAIALHFAYENARCRSLTGASNSLVEDSETSSSKIPRSHSGRIKRSNYVDKRRFKLGRVRSKV